MDELIQQQLNYIEQAARQIVAGIRGIFGYCNGMETVAKNYPLTPPQTLVGYGNQPKSTLQEIKEMIVELKIKGSIRQRANGLIELRTQAFGSIYGRTKDEIETKLTKALKEAKAKKTKEKSAEFIIPTNFDKFAMYWFENFHKRKVKESTYTENTKLYNRHIKQRFEKMSIKQITPVMLQNFLDDFSGRPKTADDIHSQLNQILTSATNHGIIKLNPMGMVFHKQHEREHGSAISKENEKKLLKAFEGTPYQLHFAVALYTGLRPNEYPTAVIEGDFIKAENSKRRNQNNGVVVYKRIPITPMLRPYLQGIERMELPKSYILYDRFKEILPDHKLYDMRTTFQTRCSECGVPDNVIGVFMGNSIGKLKDTYTDFSDEYLLSEGEKLKY